MALRTSLTRLARNAALAACKPSASVAFQSVRCIGNVEYPKITASCLQLAKEMSFTTPQLSMPLAPLYATKQKLEYLVRNIKTKEELQEVHKVLLLCDEKYVDLNTWTVGTFMNTCLKMNRADLAMDFVQKSKRLRFFMNNQSLVRLMKHFAQNKQQPKVQELWQIVQTKQVKITYKLVNAMVENLIAQGQFDDAVALAKRFAATKDINAHTITTLFQDKELEEVQGHMPLVKYLISKGEVFPNKKLTSLLNGQWPPQVQGAQVEEAQPEADAAPKADA